MQPTVEQTKEWRLKIDSFANSAKALTTYREVSLVITNLELSKMWLGQVLKNLGNPNPYPESKNPASPTIEPQAEHTDSIIFGADLTDQTARVKFLRSEIDKTVESFSVLNDNPIDEELKIYNPEEAKKNSMGSLCMVQSYCYLVNAQMWLGMELNRIRSNQLAQA